MQLLRCLSAFAAASLGVSAIGKQYDLVDLGSPGPEFHRFEVKTNNTGTLAVTGRRQLDPDNETDLEPERAFVYRNGTYTPIPNPSPWNGSAAADINEHDEVVGTFYFSGYDLTDGYLYDASTGVTQLTSSLNGLLGATAYRINDASQILGDTTALNYDAWVYDVSTGTSFVNLFGGDLAWDLNDNGQVLLSNIGGPEEVHYVYTLATGTADLIPVAPWFTTLLTLNNSGVAAGVGVADAVNVLVIYQDGAFTKVASPEGPLSVARLSDGGFVVGSYGSVDRRAYLYDGQTLRDLNSLVPPGRRRGWTLRSATDINACGEIVGYMTNAAGEAHVFRLKPRGKPCRR